MKLVVPILAILLLCVGSAYADKDDKDDKKDKLKDDSEEQHVSYYSNFPKTQLYVELDTRDRYSEEFDVFLFDVSVKNLGSKTARGTTVKLQNIPDDWHVWPTSPEKWIDSIHPGETKHVIFVVERDSEDASVHATAKARNSKQATSNVVHVPMFLSTIVLTAASIAGITLYSRR